MSTNFQMLPSMPILFSRESQDAFGNKIEPSTSFFSQATAPKSIVNLETHTEAQPVPIKPATKINTCPDKNNAEEDPRKNIESILEAALVRSYYTKVQSRFASNHSVPKSKFVQFQDILKEFDPSKETPVALYRRLEHLFGEEHKDIVDEFLLFLKPGQAAEVGRFMDHFMYLHMTNFIQMLQNNFVRKPVVLRRVLRAITTGINTGSSEAMKARVLPHLRSSPRLTQMFKMLFPDERPPESMYATGADNIHEEFLTNDKGYDIWEFDDNGSNKKKLDAKGHLDTVYLHGRVFLQHGKMLRSACVTYPYSKEPYRVHAKRLAPSYNHLSPPESEEERSPKRNKSAPKIPLKRTRKQTRSPTKNVKDVNDNTKVNSCTTNIINSPKTVKGKQSNSKNKSKDKKDSDFKDSILKKDKRDKISNIDKNEKKEEGTKSKQVKIQVPVLIENKRYEPIISWTREEDKTMLEVLKGEAGSEQVFCRIRELLPHRSVIEIKERFVHVMNLLQEMGIGEIT